jgi:predicted metal-dependent hydrolase
VRERLAHIFHETFRELRPRTPLPPVNVEFFPFANLNSTIRMRDGQLFVRLSDLLEGAPESVIRSLAHILIAKMYRKPIERDHAVRYRRHVASHEVTRKAHLVRQLRGRKRIASAKGETYDLEIIFEDLNRRFFHGLLGRPQMTWSAENSRNRLGHYDPAHNAIVISRIFDDPRIPRYAVEYIVYHEMLHLKHPVKLRGSRRCVHSAEFQREEEMFPEIRRAKELLRRL